MGIQHNPDWLDYCDFLRQFSLFCLVSPPLNNERIRRQQGAFLIFPPAQTSNWKAENVYKINAIRIKAEAKEALRSELADLGITRSYLFPALDEQAKDIMLHHPPTTDIMSSVPRKEQ